MTELLFSTYYIWGYFQRNSRGIPRAYLQNCHSYCRSKKPFASTDSEGFDFLHSTHESLAFFSWQTFFHLAMEMSSLLGNVMHKYPELVTKLYWCIENINLITFSKLKTNVTGAVNLNLTRKKIWTTLNQFPLKACCWWCILVLALSLFFVRFFHHRHFFKKQKFLDSDHIQ